MTFLLSVGLKLILDFKWKGRDLVSLFPASLKPAVAMIIADLGTIIYHIGTGDITLSVFTGQVSQLLLEDLQKMSMVGGFATGIDQVVNSWNKEHGIQNGITNSTPVVIPKV